MWGMVRGKKQLIPPFSKVLEDGSPVVLGHTQWVEGTERDRAVVHPLQGYDDSFVVRTAACGFEGIVALCEDKN